MTDELNFTLPPGRLVQGSLYQGSTTDNTGQPKLIRTGPNAGKPRTDYFVAVAIRKNPGEQHWAQTSWGAQIYALAQRAWPQGQWQSPMFAWKIVDGDSATPDQGTPPRAPNTREGFPGHWVLKFSRPVAPSIWRIPSPGAAPVSFPEVDAIKLGDFVEVNCTIKSNENAQKAGLYFNHNMVCFAGYGERIVTGPNPAAAGFGQAGLPAGASATPPAGFLPPMGAGAPAAPGFPAQIPGMAPAPGYPATQPAPFIPAQPVAPAQLPPMPGPAYSAAPALPGAPVGAPVQPHVGILTPQVPGMAPMAPAAPVGSPYAGQLIQGVPYETWVSQGWTDDLLRQHGKV